MPRFFVLAAVLVMGCADPTYGWPGHYSVEMQVAERPCERVGGEPTLTTERFAWTIARRADDLALCASPDCTLGELPLELVGGTASLVPATERFSFGERRGTLTVDRGYLTNDGATLHGSLRGDFVLDDGACVLLSMWTDAP